MLDCDSRQVTERRTREEITPRNSANGDGESLELEPAPLEPVLVSELGVISSLTVALEAELVLPPLEPILSSPLGLSSARAVERELGPMPPSEPILGSELGLRSALAVALQESVVPPPEPQLESELAR